LFYITAQIEFPRVPKTIQSEGLLVPLPSGGEKACDGSKKQQAGLRPGARLKARHRRILDGDDGEFHIELRSIAHYRKPQGIRQSHD
jgi:hypothetical protein